VASAFLPADWPAPPRIKALTTLRHGLGLSISPFDAFNLGGRYAEAGDDHDAIARNRVLLAEHAGLPSSPRWLRQVHGAGVVRFGPDADDGFELDADASVTDQAGVVLAILTADCLPGR